LGPTYHGGTDYYWNDLGIDVAGGMLPSCEVRDVTGDGQAEIIFHKRLGTARSFPGGLEGLSFGSGATPESVFQHEVGITTETGSITNDVRFVADAGKPAIVITPGSAKGYSAANYREPTETSYDPLLLPWGGIKSQTYKFQGGSFTKVT